MAGEKNQNYYFKQASFAGGLYGSHLYGRDDHERYSIGAKTMTNFFPYPYGGFSRRMGTFFVHECKYADRKCRLIPFSYSDEISFVLEVGHNYIRIYRDMGIVMNGESAVEVWTPYTEDMLDRIKFVQSADRMYICHPNVPVKTLSRYSDTDWRLEDFNFVRGPFRDQNTTWTTISATGTSGNITLNASSDIFNAGMVGTIIKLSHNIYGQTLTRTNAEGAQTTEAIMCNGAWDFHVTDPMTCTITIEISNDNGGSWKTMKSYVLGEDYGSLSDSGTIDHFCHLRVKQSWSEKGSGSYTLSCDSFIANGFVKITGFNNARQVTGTVYADHNDYLWGLASTDATTYWSIGAFNGSYGYPQTVAFYQDRLFFGATNKDPLTIWGSQSGNYNDFYISDTPEDDDGVTFSLVSGQVNKPLAFLSLGSLLAFTDASEWIINSGSSQAAITPSSISAKQQTSEGSALVDPLIINDRALFINRTGNTVRDMAYDYSTDSYKGTDQTLYNRDLFEGHRIVAWCDQKSPNNIVWCCREDGKLLSFTYIYDQKVQSWAYHETNGAFESCASIPGDLQDEVYFVVRRRINGQAKRYIEGLARRETDMPHQYYMDSMLDLSNGKTVTAIQKDASSLTIPGNGFTAGDTIDCYCGNDFYRFSVSSVNGDTVVIGNAEAHISDGTAPVSVVAEELLQTMVDSLSSGRAVIAYKCVSRISGLSHLEGMTVGIMANGSYLGEKKVVDGGFELGNMASIVICGLNYSSYFETLDIPIPVKDGTSYGRKKKVNRITLKLKDSYGGNVGINNYDHMLPINMERPGIIGVPSALYNRDYRIEPASDTKESATITVSQTQPYPLTVLSIMAEIAMG